MVWDQLFGASLSAVAGVTMAFTTATLAEHREKRRWLRRKVYQPLYGELTDAISGEIPSDDRGYASLWAGVDYYKTHRVDSELAEALDSYASDVNELSGVEHETDLAAFADALPSSICEDGSTVAELPSGRRVDVHTWLRRNLLLLATSERLADRAFAVEPTDLDYLWLEVTDMSPAQVRAGQFDTAAALTSVSKEFNWGYEVFYHQWDDGWVDDLAEALLASGRQSTDGLRPVVERRRDIGRTASGLKRAIRRRTERGFYRSLLDHLTGNWIR
ncbi:hypothetical protein [Haloarchaeobius baliensis]|uniref:hypothetical protein n=1 Tax=Haloarchaeobius baliensis TaxID=1670458 RepID=UPI003F881339